MAWGSEPEWQFPLAATDIMFLDKCSVAYYFKAPLIWLPKFSWGSKQKPRELGLDVGNGCMLEKQLWRGAQRGDWGLKPCVSMCSDSPKPPWSKSGQLQSSCPCARQFQHSRPSTQPWQTMHAGRAGLSTVRGVMASTQPAQGSLRKGIRVT